MTPEVAEKLERTTMEMVVQAIVDYLDEAKRIFREESDLAQDIAEDVVMREAVEAMGVSGFQERLYGKVDYKRAIYVFTPEPNPVALMLDAKAEKGNGSATIQMSQTSMRVEYRQRGESVVESGKLPSSLSVDGRNLQVVSIIAKYLYGELPEGYQLKETIAACIPSGLLQSRYNPSPYDTIWRVGRHAPTLGEDFRARLSYNRLAKKASWRVRKIR